MKFCPHCGTSLPGGAVSFCPECGKKLLSRQPTNNAKKNQRPAQYHQRPKSRKKPVDPMDVNYDGYYDDVPTIDANEQGDRMDPAMVRQIALVLAGTVGLIIFSIVLMNVL